MLGVELQGSCAFRGVHVCSILLELQSKLLKGGYIRDYIGNHYWAP